MHSIAPDDRIVLLQSMPIFGGLSAATLEFLLDLSKLVDRDKGQYFYREGDPGHSVYVLERGEVGMFKHWQEADYKIDLLKRGDSFGQVALIDLGPRNTSTLALRDSSALKISAHDLYKLYNWNIEQFTVMYMNMARDICRRLRRSDQRAFEADMLERLPE